MKKWKQMLLLSCVSAVFTCGMAGVSFAASGWAEENGTWVYKNSSGENVANAFKKSGDYWFYLGDDGTMVTSSLIEHNDEYYYLTSTGSMAVNQWRYLESDGQDEDDPGSWWYYFQSNGKAVKRSSAGNSVKFVTLPTTSGNAKFTFDEEGRGLFGWIGEEGERLTDEDAWKSGVYYCGEQSDGRQALGWKYLEAEDDEETDRDGDGYWFYFGNNGKKVTDSPKKTINGRKYRFDENGRAEFEWYAKPAASQSAASASNSYYYNTEEQCWLATGWFKMVPNEDIDPEGYDDGDTRWFYAQSNGDLTVSKLKTINGQRYGFDPYGKMLHGLYKVYFDTDKTTILQAEEIEDESDIPDTGDDSFQVYYFADSPKEGAMKTGACSITMDGEKYNYKFKKSGSDKGAGITGIDDGAIYIEGRRMEAEKEIRYEPYTYEGVDYLINTSGQIQKSKTNLKDADELYYCTNSRGEITYQGYEKYKK